MSERYTKLFSLPENLYAAGSPVIIAAGALYKDNRTGNVLAQLKLKSISEKDIRAVKACLNLFDTAGIPIGKPVMFDYLDLNTARDAEFGKKTPVPVPEAKARSYTAAVTEVVFSDKSTWVSNGTKFEPLPRQRTLEDVFRDTELVKQFKIAVGSSFTYYPMQEKDLWFCACGAVNHEGKPCHVCKRTLPELQSIDRERLVRDKDARLAEEARRAAEEKAAADAQRKKTTKMLKIVIPTVCVIIAIAVAATALIKPIVIPTIKYYDAVSLMNEGKYEEAIAEFEALSEYRDSKNMIRESKAAIENLRLQEIYDAAAELANSGKTTDAAITFGKLSDFQDSRERSFALWNPAAFRNVIGAGFSHTVGLKSDSTVVAVGRNKYGQCDVSGWTDIVAVSAGKNHTVGLKSDGTVIAAGDNSHGQCDVSGWTDIVAVNAGDFHTVGLKSDGTVVAVGYNKYSQCDVSEWYDIVTVSARFNNTAGLKSDGSVVAIGDNSHGQCDVREWHDIVAVSVGNFHTVGIKSNGTVVAVGDNGYGKCDVNGWKDIVAVSAGWCDTVGLKSDGTVVVVGGDWRGMNDVDGWTDIVAVSAGDWHTVGLKADGTVVAVGRNEFGKCNVSSWTDIKLPK